MRLGIIPRKWNQLKAVGDDERIERGKPIVGNCGIGDDPDALGAGEFGEKIDAGGEFGGIGFGDGGVEREVGIAVQDTAENRVDRASETLVELGDEIGAARSEGINAGGEEMVDPGAEISETEAGAAWWWL